MTHDAPPLGRFRPVSFHARGGLGEVLIARDAELGCDVALKRILPDQADNPSARVRFVREAELTGRLEHPGIVPVYGLGCDGDGRPYYAMRFIGGESLAEAIRRHHGPAAAGVGAVRSGTGAARLGTGAARPAARGPAADRRSVEFRGLLTRFVSVCQTVAYAHAAGVLHRDLKPSNVMLGEFGETLVVDWGLAKALGDVEGAGDGDEGPAGVAERPVPPGPDDSTGSDGDAFGDFSAAATGIGTGTGSSATLFESDATDADTAGRPVGARGTGRRGTATPAGPVTRTGSRLGTPGYMSPEQCRGENAELTPASDIYSLGGVLYAVLTGRGPLEDVPAPARLLRTSMGDVPRPSRLRPGVPAALEAVCLKAMAVEPADRYRDARALAADVEAWLADEPVSAWREPWTVRAVRWMRKRRTLVGSAAAAALAAGIAAGAGLWIVAAKNRQLDEARLAAEAQRDRALTAEAAEKRARGEAEDRRAEAEEHRRRADEQRAKAEGNFALARKAVAECLDLARSAPAFAKPGA
jgi:serine/threonine protein kinase